jgi:hypothetical protein
MSSGGHEMTYESGLAASYRDRSRQLRGIADLDADQKNASALRKIAAHYDKMADSLIALDAEQRKRLRA